MTASKTPRLGLMSPTGSDAFVTQDFADLTAILDANPGIAVVPNAAARPTSYTTAQHGSIVGQVDQGILLQWYQPNSGVAGYWNRLNSKGWLATFTNNSPGGVSTSSRNYSNGPTVVSGSVTLPGGRPMLVLVHWHNLQNDYSIGVLNYWENSSNQAMEIFPADDNYMNVPGNWWLYRNPAPNSAATINLALTLNSYNASPPSGGGTTWMSNVTMSVFEL